MVKLCIYGCGGMGREIADLAYRTGSWSDILFVDDNIKDRIIDDVNVYTLAEVIEKFGNDDLEFVIAAGEPTSRENIFIKLKSKNLKVIKYINNETVLSRLSSVDEGTFIHVGTDLTVNVHVGKGCLINKHVIIGHDVNVGSFSVLSPNVTVGGDVNIGEGCYVGSGAIIRNGISIGSNAIVGMGAVVTKSVEANAVVVGNPAKFVRNNNERKVFK